MLICEPHVFVIEGLKSGMDFTCVSRVFCSAADYPVQLFAKVLSDTKDRVVTLNLLQVKRENNLLRV